ncbi:MAG TPA: M56 family metallopeptidase [Candidatus Cybelea sp.]|nr:M56 family metallopeptidase [Candidatus Cybelea sp.]
MNMPLWFSNLLFWSAQLALVVLAAEFLPRLFQIRQPQVLLRYWRTLLLLTLVLPFLQPWHRLPSIAPAVVFGEADNLRFATPAPAVTHWHFPSVPVVAEGMGIAVLGGIVFRFALLVLGLLRLRRFREASTPITNSAESAAILNHMRATVGASAEFRLSANVDSPVTFGLAKPVILLPERFLETDARFQSAIACHELLHIRRRDWAQHLVEEIVRAVFWFQPAMAWLISRVRLAREQVVDLEVIRLTNARRAYLQALLEFTAGQTRIAAIPAPPFLAERQLVERISIMLKEVRMSRGRLLASFAVISCCLAGVVGLCAWSFPMKLAPLESAPKTGDGVAGGISGGVTGGVSGGVTDGVSSDVGGLVSARPSSDIPNVDYSTIWIDTVKRGPMQRQVRGLGKLVRGEGSTNFVAQVTLPTFLTADVKPGQNAAVATRKGSLANGHVSSISPSTSDDTRTVDIALDAVPEGTAAGLEVDGTIDIEKIDSVLQVGRPVHGAENTGIPLFKIVNNGADAVRIYVKLGRASVNTIEVLAGLEEGDRIILSDMSQFKNADRIHLTREQHVPRQ